MNARHPWSRAPRLGAILLAVLVLAATLTRPPAAHAAGREAACADPGRRLPVVLVHGLAGRPADLDVLAARLGALGAAVTAFDYRSVADRWVTDARIGPALADTIDCLARASAREGGPGRVAVVAHSMGGLALADAAAEVRHGAAVATRLAAVATIGTPFEGAFAARAGAGAARANDVTLDTVERAACALHDRGRVCDVLRGIHGPAVGALAPGSPELRALPALPATVPVLAIAGAATVSVHALGRAFVVGEVGDGLVAVDSATAGARRVDGVGGRLVLRCAVDGGDCTHVALRDSPRVGTAVVDLLRTWLRTHPRGTTA